MIMCSRQRTMIAAKAVMDRLPEDAGFGPVAPGVLARFRREFHACLSARADELCELADAVLCSDGPVRNLAALSLAPGHRRGHGALYDAVNCGRIEIGRRHQRSRALRRHRAAGICAVDVTSYLHPKFGALARHRTQYPIVPSMLPQTLLQQCSAPSSSAVPATAAGTPPSAAGRRRRLPGGRRAARRHVSGGIMPPALTRPHTVAPACCATKGKTQTAERR